MITAEGYHIGNILRLQITYLGETKVELKEIRGSSPEEREATGLNIYFGICKNYVSTKLYSWLKQRMFILEKVDVKRSQQAFKLMVLINYHNQFNYFKLCKLIAENREVIETLAPKTHSDHYPYYNRVIRAILKECDTMKARAL